MCPLPLSFESGMAVRHNEHRGVHLIFTQFRTDPTVAKSIG